MKKNGFVFVETIIVVAVLATSLILMYISFNKIIINEKKRITYDDISYIYRTYYLEDFLTSLNMDKYVQTHLISRSSYISEFSCADLSLYNAIDENNIVDSAELAKEQYCEKLVQSSALNVNHIYIVKNDVKKIVDCTDKDGNITCSDAEIGDSDLRNLSANAIAYLRTLASDGTDNYRFVIEYAEDNGSGGKNYYYSNVLLVSYGLETFTINFNGNGGTVPDVSLTKRNGDTYGTLPNPTRANFDYLGWYTDAYSGSQITESSVVALTNNQTLYAHWKGKEYTINFNVNGGGTVSPSSKTVTYDAVYGTLPTPVRAGYGFNGWFTTASGGSQIISSSKVLITSNTTFYAHWTANSYTLTYNANGGTVSPTSKSIVQDSKYGTLPTPSKAGYTFNGWYTALSGGTQITSDSTFTSAADTTIYAHWTANNYTITFNGNGGTPSLGSKVVTYNTVYGDLPTASKDYYTFLGWFTAASGGSQVTSSSIYSTPANVTVYAHWTANHYTMDYNPDLNKYGVNFGSGARVQSMDLTIKDENGNTIYTATGISDYCDAQAVYNGTYYFTNVVYRTGYIYNGYTLRNDSSDAASNLAMISVGANGTSFTFKHSVGGTMWFSINTKPKTVTTYFKYGGQVNTQVFTYGTSGQSFANTGFTYSGHEIDGWATYDGGPVVYATYSGVADSWIDASYPSVNLYAHWKSSTYYVSQITADTGGMGCNASRSNSIDSPHFIGGSSISTSLTKNMYVNGQGIYTMSIRAVPSIVCTGGEIWIVNYIDNRNFTFTENSNYTTSTTQYSGQDCVLRLYVSNETNPSGDCTEGGFKAWATATVNY